ncbi:MAG: hypothetical protein R3F22_10275 [Lysobacteraceae bacterium]
MKLSLAPWVVPMAFGALAGCATRTPLADGSPASSSDIEIVSVSSVKVVSYPWYEECKRAVVEPIDVSMVQLLANPERYNGKPVSVIGYYNSGFELSALYLSKLDSDNDVNRNSVWVEGLGAYSADDGYAYVSGIFSQKVTGHLNGWSAGICNVSEYEPWPGHQH